MKVVWLLLLAVAIVPFLLFSEELEVCLRTRSSLTPIYVSGFFSKSPQSKAWEKTREILKRDLTLSGSVSIARRDPKIEASLQDQVFKQGGLSFPSFENKGFALFFVCEVLTDKLKVSAVDLLRRQMHTYFSLDLERASIHKLVDQIQWDLFGKKGICSSKLIYTVRSQKADGKKGWVSEVWTADYDGMNARQVTRENSYCFCPFFIPGSSDEFIYSSEKKGQSKIYRASLSCPEGKPVIDLRGNQALASMRGMQMAFIADVSGRPDLFIQHFDSMGSTMGPPRQLFSAPRSTQASPTFSPDGQKLAFVSDKDGPPRIYLLDIFETKVKRKAHPELLTRRNRENTSPCWSSDGTKLAYSAKVDGVRQIWIYDFIEREEFALTEGPGHKENPSWGPDSFHLVYNTENEDVCHLYLIDLGQKQPVCIGEGRFATWNLPKETNP